MAPHSTLLKIDPSKTNAWKLLQQFAPGKKQKHLTQYFTEDRQRVEKYSLEWKEFYLDYSKNLIDDEVKNTLLSLAKEVKLHDGIEKMFQGKRINETEQRSVLHIALRTPANQELVVDQVNVVQEVHAVLQKMRTFTQKLNEGNHRGFQDDLITDIVNIGIGGSDLGPMMVTHALKPYAFADRRVHFVSNVDGSDIHQVLNGLNPKTTLFIIASKTFTTIETMTNAHTAKQWFLQDAKVEDVKKHFVAVSTNTEGVENFGIDPHNMFGFWNWVGGRFSLSSAVGLSIMLATSPVHFDDLLAGMHAMDLHFRSAPLEANMPVILALLGIWYINFLEAETHAVLPYDQNLQFLPKYLQQAAMESNGKSVKRDGKPVTYQTDAVLWGSAGTNSQHSFFQLLHQGTRLIPCDFILPINPAYDLPNHHDLLVANALAQTEALMRGKDQEEVRRDLTSDGLDPQRIDELVPFKAFEGGRPSNLLMIKKNTPFNLGALIAMYEHKIFVQGYIWDIFSFDQFGVELGKALAKAIQPELHGPIHEESHDPSTITALKKFKTWYD